MSLNIKDVFDNFNNFKLDLLGVTNLFGGDIAISAIRYCIFERKRIWWSTYLIPGLFTIAKKLLIRSDNPLATALSPGTRDECRDIVGLKETGDFFYVGLLSGTRMKVVNVIGEAVLNTSKAKEPKLRPVTIEDLRRPTNVSVIEVKLKAESNSENTNRDKSKEKGPKKLKDIGQIETGNPINIIFQ